MAVTLSMKPDLEFTGWTK